MYSVTLFLSKRLFPNFTLYTASKGRKLHVVVVVVVNVVVVVVAIFLLLLVFVLPLFSLLSPLSHRNFE